MEDPPTDVTMIVEPLPVLGFMPLYEHVRSTGHPNACMNAKLCGQAIADGCPHDAALYASRCYVQLQIARHWRLACAWAVLSRSIFLQIH